MIFNNNKFTCDMSSSFFEIYFDENNNMFSSSIGQSESENYYQLSEQTFSFKNNLMQNIKNRNLFKNCQDNLRICKENNKCKFLNRSENYQEEQILKNDEISLNDDYLEQEKLNKHTVKRALFVEKDEINHEANLNLVKQQLDILEKSECEKWNFDFKNNRPLNNENCRYEWFKENSHKSSTQLQQDSTEFVDKKENSLEEDCKVVKTILDKKSKKISSDSNLVSTCSNQMKTKGLKRKLSLNDYFTATKKKMINGLLVKSSNNKNNEELKTTDYQEDSILKVQTSCMNQQVNSDLNESNCTKFSSLSQSSELKNKLNVKNISNQSGKLRACSKKKSKRNVSFQRIKFNDCGDQNLTKKKQTKLQF